MKKFEEELFSEVPCKFGLNTEGEYKQSILIKHFKDWISPEDHQAEINKLKSQLEKQKPEIPEVPQFVADWLDKKPLYTINSFIPVEIIEWSKKQTGYADLGMNINHLLKLRVNGYTVAKEKRFYLKNKLTGQRLIRLLEENGGGFLECVTSIDKERMQFTQSEIDSMAAESYEQIEVEE